MRRPFTKVRYQALLAVSLRPKFEDLLLPIFFFKQKTAYEIREFLRGGAFEILGIVVEDQGVADFEELHEFAPDTRIGGGFPVIQVIDVAFQKRVFRVKFHDAEGKAAGSEDVHPAVFVVFYDVENLGGAADARDALGKRKKHAEFGLFFQTVFHHFAVTRLENVQRKFRAGKKDDVQRKERNAIRPHGSQVKMIPEEVTAVPKGQGGTPPPAFCRRVCNSMKRKDLIFFRVQKIAKECART